MNNNASTNMRSHTTILIKLSFRHVVCNLTLHLKTWNVLHVCTPINWRYWFWQKAGKRSRWRRPCPPKIGRQLEILHTNQIHLRLRLKKFDFWLSNYCCKRIGIAIVKNQIIIWCVCIALNTKHLPFCKRLIEIKLMLIVKEKLCVPQSANHVC